MDAGAIKAVLADLQAEQERLLEVMKRTQAELARVRAASMSLELVIAPPEQPEFEGKLTDAVREVLRRSAGKSLSPLEVRDLLKGLNYDLSVHKNPMASIHSVLKRLADPQKEIRSKEARDGSGTRYWAVAEVASTSATRPIALDVLTALAGDPNRRAALAEAVQRSREEFTRVQDAIRSAMNPAAIAAMNEEIRRVFAVAADTRIDLSALTAATAVGDEVRKALNASSALTKDVSAAARASSQLADDVRTALEASTAARKSLAAAAGVAAEAAATKALPSKK